MRSNPHEGPLSDDMIRLREDLLDGIVRNAAFDGWTPQALKAAADGLGVPRADARRAFPGGMIEAAEAWSEMADAEMLAILSDHDPDTLKIRERVAFGVRARLSAVAEHKESVRRFSSFLALPVNAPMAPRLVWRTCDHIWRWAGDTATDHNHYTKRGLLAPVYTSTVLYWLADEGDEAGDWPATWGYLDRRIDNVIQVFGRLGKAGNRIRGLMPSPIAQAFAPRGS